MKSGDSRGTARDAWEEHHLSWRERTRAFACRCHVGAIHGPPVEDEGGGRLYALRKQSVEVGVRGHQVGEGLRHLFRRGLRRCAASGALLSGLKLETVGRITSTVRETGRNLCAV